VNLGTSTPIVLSGGTFTFTAGDEDGEDTLKINMESTVTASITGTAATDSFALTGAALIAVPAQATGTGLTIDTVTLDLSADSTQKVSVTQNGVLKLNNASATIKLNSTPTAAMLATSGSDWTVNGNTPTKNDSAKTIIGHASGTTWTAGSSNYNVSKAGFATGT
jgi:hypothetical protein